MRWSGFLATVLACSALAVGADTPPGQVGDKSRGEEAQILARERWFGIRRGLDRVDRADLKRRAAVEEVRERRDQARGRLAGATWQPLGPESMAMLDWDMGPVSGRVAALAVKPSDEDVLYLGGASGGLWKSTNGGGSWSSVFDEVGTQTIGSIAVDPAAPDTVWVGTGEQARSCWDYFGLGLYRSTDGGVTWQERNGSAGATLDASYVSTIAIHPTIPGLVLAGGHGYCSGGGYYYGGLYRSTDSGGSWTQVLSGAISDVVVDPVSPSTLFAARGRFGQVGDGVYRSTDAGVTWGRLESGLPVDSGVARTRLAMAPSNHLVVYALNEDKLHRTTDGGNSWTTRSTSACDGQCWYDLCLAVHPTNPETLLVGAILFYRSTNGGSTLTPLVDGWGGSQKVHQDIHVLVYSTTNPNRFWVAGDGGLWRTDNGGSTFSNLNANLNLTQFYDVAVHPSDPATLFGGAQDNSSSRRVGAQQWQVTVDTGDGFMNVVDPADPDLVFQTSYPSGGYPSLCKSTAGGAPSSFDWVWNLRGLTQNEPYPWVTPLVALDRPGSLDTPLFLASSYLYRSTTTQPTYWFQWTKISPDLTGSSDSAVSVITPVRVGSTIGLYVGTENGKIWWCGDALAAAPAFVDVTGTFPVGWVSDIAADPGDPSRVYVTRGEFGGSRLYRSTVGGGTWTAVGAGIPDVPANAVAVDPATPTRVLVGSDVGVFESLDSGDTFAPLTAGLPLGVVVTDLEVDDDPHRLTAGTYGRGAWQLDLDWGGLFADDFESGSAAAWSQAVP